MKLVVAVLNPLALGDIKERVLAVGVRGMTITEAHGFGHEPGHTEVYRGAEYEVDFVPKLRVEIVADDDQADLVVDVIARWATTGHVGDGMVWVMPVDTAVRISTGQRGVAALA
jgi:nitrogen regulatory protein P-II 1